MNMPTPIRFYLAASFARMEEARRLRDDIVASLSFSLMNYEPICTSRWLSSERTNLDYGTSAEFSIEDLEDVSSADFMVQLCGDGPTNGTRGGRHTELGAALVLRKAVFLLSPNGEPEQVFHHHPFVECFSVAKEMGQKIGQYMTDGRWDKNDSLFGSDYSVNPLYWGLGNRSFNGVVTGPIYLRDLVLSPEDVSRLEESFNVEVRGSAGKVEVCETGMSYLPATSPLLLPEKALSRKEDSHGGCNVGE